MAPSESNPFIYVSRKFHAVTNGQLQDAVFGFSLAGVFFFVLYWFFNYSISKIKGIRLIPTGVTLSFGGPQRFSLFLASILLTVAAVLAVVNCYRESETHEWGNSLAPGKVYVYRMAASAVVFLSGVCTVIMLAFARFIRDWVNTYFKYDVVDLETATLTAVRVCLVISVLAAVSVVFNVIRLCVFVVKGATDA